MQKTLIIAFGAALALSGAAQAEVTGAQIGLDYSTYGDSGMRDEHKATLGGSLEYAITPSFSFQGDLAQRYYGLANWSGTTGTAHAIFHTPSGTAIGAYYGNDWVRGKDPSYYGVEAATQVDRVKYEGFLGYISGSEAAKGANYGVSGTYGVNDNLSLGGKFAGVSNDSDLMRLGLTAGYQFSQGFALDGELGLADQRHEDKEVYLSLGLKASFGANNGVTFGGRGLQELWPGN